MKKLLVLSALILGMANLSHAEGSYLYGNVESVDDETGVVVIDGTEYTLALTYGGQSASDVVAKGNYVAFQVAAGALTYVDNNPPLSFEDEEAYDPLNPEANAEVEKPDSSDDPAAEEDEDE